MDTFETTATVEAHGQVYIAGVPFEPGTQVEVTIREKAVTESKASTPEEASLTLKQLFARVQARNTEPVGPLRREELYDRKVLR